LRITYPLESGFPVKLTAHKQPDIIANDDSELLAALAQIFHAPATVEIVQKLMTLAGE